jgi:hypothetical protein
VFFEVFQNFRHHVADALLALVVQQAEVGIGLCQL